ncbi:MAG TPA: hypothetical protein VK088_02890, partial [Acidimicrobiia bacterium]|nr:hypothetical protein [Acidimicrobiia bacterium]
MNVPESVLRIVAAARRRLLAAGMTARVVGWVGAAAALAAALAAVARVRVIEWADLVVVVMVGVAAVAAVVWSMIRRPTPQGAAIVVDRRLGGYDRVTTALELGTHPEPSSLEVRQLEAASAWADSRDVTDVASLMPPRPAVGLTSLAIAVLAALVLVPAPTDVALAARQADREAISDEADRLREMAEE